MIGYTVANALGCLLVIVAMAMVLTKDLKRSALLYSLQSLVLVAIFVALAQATESKGLLIWAVSAFITKVLLAPGIMLVTIRKMRQTQQSQAPALKPALFLVICALELAICFAVISSISLASAQEVKPALGIALGLFFAGITCVIAQRNIIKQIFGYLLMENGSHLMLALLAPTVPEIVEVGIATDAILTVLVMCILAFHIFRSNNTLDTDELHELKG